MNRIISKLFFISLLVIPSVQASNFSESQPDFEGLARKHLSVYLFGCETQAKDLAVYKVDMDAESHHALRLYTCKAPEVRGKVNSLFVKIVNTGCNEAERLSIVERYFKEKTEGHFLESLCLPVYSCNDFKQQFTILLFPIAIGLDFDHVIEEFKQDKIETAHMDVLHRRLGGTIGKLHAAGGLVIDEGKLKSHCVHGDLHSENLFCDKAKGIFQLIDLETMACSIEQEEKVDVGVDFFAIFMQTINCHCLFIEGQQYPYASHILNFIKGYIEGCGLRNEEVAPVLYRYTILKLIQGGVMINTPITIEDMDESDDEESGGFKLKGPREVQAILLDLDNLIRKELTIPDSVERHEQLLDNFKN